METLKTVVLQVFQGNKWTDVEVIGTFNDACSIEAILYTNEWIKRRFDIDIDPHGDGTFSHNGIRYLIMER